MKVYTDITTTTGVLELRRSSLSHGYLESGSVLFGELSSDKCDDVVDLVIVDFQILTESIATLADGFVDIASPEFLGHTQDRLAGPLSHPLEIGRAHV